MGINNPVTPEAIGAVPIGRTLTAGANMSGGGDLSANRAFAAIGGGGGSIILADFDFTITPAINMPVDITGHDQIEIRYTGLTTPAGSFGTQLSDDGGLTYYNTLGDYLLSTFNQTVASSSATETMFRFGSGAAANVIGYQFISGLNLASAIPRSHAIGNREVGALGASVSVMPTIRGPFDFIKIAGGANFTAGQLQVLGY